MAANAFADWLARGRAHQGEARPADAIPCFRRAAREDPRSPVPHFHLGEVLWQLGLTTEALQAWRTAAGLDRTFLAPRLALAEAAMTHGDFASASVVAREALLLAPHDARARATSIAASAATGDRGDIVVAASLFAADPALARIPSLAMALAAALAAVPESEERDALLRTIAPHAATLPAGLLASLAESGAAIPDSVAGRPWTLADAEALRRLAVLMQRSNTHVAERLAIAYSALCGSLPPPPVPLVWPRRTAGQALRVAWLCPTPASTGWEAGRAALVKTRGAFSIDAVSFVILCAGDVGTTRASLAAALGDAPTIAMPLATDAGIAKVIAAYDCDVLIDAAGLTAATARLLSARPARANWALAAGTPVHREPLVERTFATSDALVTALRELRGALTNESGCPLAADRLTALWDRSVRQHQHGDLAAAAEGYGQVVAIQPGFAPALHLLGVVALAQDERERARDMFDAAVAAAPEFGEARLSSADLALAMRDPERAIRVLHDGLARAPWDVALLRMLGHAQLALRDGAAAEETFRHVLVHAPADGDAHFNHGIALQMLGDSPGAARAYQRALTFKPDLIAADFNLGVLFQQQANTQAAIAAYSNVLAADPRHITAYKNLGEVLLAAGQIEAWLANFRAFEKHCPKALPLAVYALEACQHQADFTSLERYIDGLRKEEFQARDEEELVDCLEELLYLLLFFDVEPGLLLRFARAYDAVAVRVYGTPMPRAAARRPGLLRVGYLSADLRNHVMGKMMWQAIAHHDRTKVECYFYANSSERDEWTQRFESAGKRFAVIAGQDDAHAAALINDDDLDVLVDLSTHTRGARPGILARKPARVQVTHVASAGTVGLSAIDYKLTDHYADVPENQEFQIERLLAMNGCVFPFRHVAPAVQHPFDRRTLGLPADAIVIGAFVNPLKLSRRCLDLWRDVLARIPRAMLAFSPANPALRDSYLRLARATGIAKERIVFLPQGRDDAENQARYRIVDFVLDTMPFGGVNGTIEALDMSVPVVTLVGKRHGERTSFSILSNLGVTATIANTGRDYAEIAVRLADDPAFRTEVSAAINAGLLKSPLVDMAGHTRNLEAAYRSALAERAAEVPASAHG